jgi:hypothetical protein
VEDFACGCGDGGNVVDFAVGSEEVVDLFGCEVESSIDLNALNYKNYFDAQNWLVKLLTVEGIEDDISSI